MIAAQFREAYVDGLPQFRGAYIWDGGVLFVVEAPDGFAAAGRQVVRGGLVAIDVPDSFAAAGRSVVRGGLAAHEHSDAFVGAGRILVRAGMVAHEGTDIALGVARSVARAAMSVREVPDKFSAIGPASSRPLGALRPGDIRQSRRTRTNLQRTRRGG